MCLIPAIGTAHSLASVNKLGSWFAKEVNATSAALSAMLIDVKLVQKSSTASRVAVDSCCWLKAMGAKILMACAT